MFMYYYIYKITNKINSKIYIGVHSTTNLDDGYMGSGKAIKSAIRKYGKDVFDKEIIEHFNSYEDMISKEIEIVNYDFISTNKTYNACIGGQGGQWKGYTKDTHPIVHKWAEKVSATAKANYASGNRTIWDKGKETPYAAENGRKSADKLRQKALGRRKHILPDGSWKYPETDEGPKPLSD